MQSNANIARRKLLHLKTKTAPERIGSGEKIFLEFLKKGLDILVRVCYDKPVSKSGTARPPEIQKGGDNMTVLEILGLLNLLAVVIFGVIDVTKKKK